MIRSETRDDHFDLLPFIAILMCVLGCLLLVTISVSAISMGVSAGEAWIPDSSSTAKRKVPDKIPILIEWDGEEAAFHVDDKRLVASFKPQRTVSFGGMTFLIEEDEDDDSNDEFNQYLDEVSALKDTHYALIAVRPTGFTNFSRLASAFRREDIEIGYEPLEQNRAVKLRLPSSALLPEIKENDNR